MYVCVCACRDSFAITRVRYTDTQNSDGRPKYKSNTKEEFIDQPKRTNSQEICPVTS